MISIQLLARILVHINYFSYYYCESLKHLYIVKHILIRMFTKTSIFEWFNKVHIYLSIYLIAETETV